MNNVFAFHNDGTKYKGYHTNKYHYDINNDDDDNNSGASDDDDADVKLIIMNITVPVDSVSVGSGEHCEEEAETLNSYSLWHTHDDDDEDDVHDDDDDDDDVVDDDNGHLCSCVPR